MAGTQGLEVVDTDRNLQSMGRWSSICYVSAATYPMTLPYRDEDNEGSVMTGRLPRVMNIILTTMVVSGHRDWYRRTRTLELSSDWRVMCMRAGLSTGGDGVDRTRRLFQELADSTVTTPDGRRIPPVESLSMPQRGIVGGIIVFSDEYVRMLTRTPRELPFNALATVRRSPLMLDMLVLAALYCPDDRPLLIERSSMFDILPATSKQSLGKRSLSARFDTLNSAQDKWRFRVDKRRVIISPADIWTSVRDGDVLSVPSVTLVRHGD